MQFIPFVDPFLCQPPLGAGRTSKTCPCANMQAMSCRVVVMDHVGIFVLVNESFLNNQVPGGYNDLIDFAKLIILKMIYY